jgi:hypothetical protein
MSTDRTHARPDPADQLIPPITTRLAAARWCISSFSGAGNCMAVARLDDGSIAVRNSNHPEAATLLLAAGPVRAFVDGVKAGEFDGLS